MKTIIAATDFSASATNAAKYAAAIANSSGASLFLFHAYQVPVTYSELPIAYNLEDMLRSTEREMTLLKERLAGKYPALSVDTIVKMGTFHHELQEVCEELRPYAVIMGSQGSSAAERFFFGGHTVYAMRHLKWPLISVPPGVKFSSIKKIGLACDLHKVADTVPVAEINAMVKDFNAEFHVLNTGKQGVYDPEESFQAGLLGELLEGLNPKFHFINEGNQDEAILEFSENNQLDLLMVLPKRHGLIDKLLHKSHSKTLVLHSHVPVLALHTRE